MKKIFGFLSLVMAAAVVLTFSSCNKAEDDVTNPTTGPTSNFDAFLGSYQILVETDSIGVDGTWQSNEDYRQMTGDDRYPDKYGEMTITKGSGNYVDVVATVIMNDEEVPYYVTTGTLNAAGQLVLAPSVWNPNGQVCNFTYGAISSGDPLVFRSEMSVVLYGMNCGYIMTNTCTRH